MGFRRYSFENISEHKRTIYIVIGIILAIGIGVFLYFLFSGKVGVPDLKMVSGTEYISNEQGQIIVRLQDSSGVSITDAHCIVSLLYPDKSYFFIDREMTQTTVPGNYYTSFITPETEGIYEEYIRCTVIRNGNERTMQVSSSFHVSTGLNLIVEVSRSQREQYVALVQRLNDLDNNLTERINSVDARVYGVQNYIDNNVMNEFDNVSNQFNTVNGKINDINVSISDSMNGIEGRLNTTMLTNFSELYSKFKSSYNAMANVFDMNNP